MKKLLFIMMTALILFSCQKERGEDGVSGSSSSENSISAETEFEEELVQLEKGKSQYHSVIYNSRMMSAVDFIKKRGETPSPEDLEQLKKEHVLVMEFQDLIAKGSTMESENIRLNEQDLASYMMGGILEDVAVLQDSDTLLAHSSHFDRDISNVSKSGKLRVFLFFNNIDTNKEFETQYFDRLFGAGLMQL